MEFISKAGFMLGLAEVGLVVSCLSPRTNAPEVNRYYPNSSNSWSSQGFDTLAGHATILNSMEQ